MLKLKLLKASRTKVLFQLISLIITLFSCQEPYFNNELDANEKIPVFYVVLTNINTLNFFYLCYAKPYNSQYEERITGATIIISDNTNQEIILNEVSAGIYKLPTEYKSLEFNHEYTATVNLSDGTMLKSDSIHYFDTLPCEKVYATFENKTSLVEISEGKYSNITEFGVFANFTLKQPNSEPIYFRSSANYYVHSQKWVHKIQEKFQYTEKYTIAYEIVYDTLYDIYEGYGNGDFPVIGELLPEVNYSNNNLTFKPLFLPTSEVPRDFSRYTPDFFIEWIIPIYIYHTSAETYNYYLNITKMFKPTGQIFDPVPQQLTSNIHNITNPSKKVLGWVDIVSVNRKYLSVGVTNIGGGLQYTSKELIDPIIKSGWYPRLIKIDTIKIDTFFHEGF